MPRIVLKCPYLRGSTKKTASHRSNLVTYMATRSGVEKLPKPKTKVPSILKQEDLIQKIITEFPESKQLFEYEDYMDDKSVENASEFITMALEQNMDEIGQRENYVDYIANRPRVDLRGTHGLFTGGDDEIVLSQIADEVANHPGNIWIPIISLRRDDAIRTGFDNADTWHNMLSYYALEIAEAMKIPIQNFRWYAAFHNESHHPHVHMVCYSINPAEGFLTKKGIEKMKSGLVKNIFKHEMPMIYAEQNNRRDVLKKESQEVLLKLIREVKNGVIENPKLEELFLYLSDELKQTTGKKVYGYLKTSLKSVVDEIVDELSKVEQIGKAYHLWYEMREEVFHSYLDELPERLPISQQKEFKSIKNMIIFEADKFSSQAHDFGEEDDSNVVRSFDDVFIDKAVMEGEIVDDIESDNKVDDKNSTELKTFYVDWTEDYKIARDYLVRTESVMQNFETARSLLEIEAQKGNVLAIYDLGRMYFSGLGVEKDSEIASDYFQKAFIGFNEVEEKKAWKYTEYRIGKMLAAELGAEQNHEKAASWFMMSADQNYKYAQYSLGTLYYQGQGVEQNYQKAFELYRKAARQNFPYADFDLAKMYRDGLGTEINDSKSSEHFKRAFEGFEILERINPDDKIQYRLGWMLKNGIGVEKNFIRAKEYFKKSASLGNAFAKFALAKLILKEEHPDLDELHKAVEYLNTIIDIEDEALVKMKDIVAYTLGKLYIEGRVVTKDIHLALSYLKISADEGNQYAQFALGKIYLLGKEVLKDKDKAIWWLTLSAEQGNEYARFFLENIDRYHDPSVVFCLSRMMNHMGKIFEDNMISNRQGEEMKVDSKLLRKMREKKRALGLKQEINQYL